MSEVRTVGCIVCVCFFFFEAEENVCYFVRVCVCVKEMLNPTNEIQP